jgi:hypothetical protein
MIWTFSKSRGTARPSRIEETGHQKNFYSVADKNGAYHDAIDQMLQRIESKAAVPYRMLLSGDIPRGQLRADFSSFVATCFSRSPAFIRSYAEGTARMMQLELRLSARDRKAFERLADSMEAETGEKVENRSEVFEFLNDATRYTLGVSEKLGLKAIGFADGLAPILFSRGWAVVTAVGDSFITSDNPVYRWVPQETAHPIYGDGGFENARAEVTFPLSTNKMLLIAATVDTEEPVFVDADDVRHLNRMRAVNAEEFLFSHQNDERVQSMAREFKDTRPRMTIGHKLARDVEVNIKR